MNKPKIYNELNEMYVNFNDSIKKYTIYTDKFTKKDILNDLSKFETFFSDHRISTTRISNLIESVDSLSVLEFDDNIGIGNEYITLVDISVKLSDILMNETLIRV